MEGSGDKGAERECPKEKLATPTPLCSEGSHLTAWEEGGKGSEGAAGRSPGKRPS